MDVRTILERLHGVIQSGEVRPAPVENPPLLASCHAERVATVLRERGPEAARAVVDRLHREHTIDRVSQLSALQVIAASPSVRDYREAMRLTSLLELVALDDADDVVDALASADRHRGVVAFHLGRLGVALEAFSRALQRDRSPESFANVLAVLVEMGDVDEATELVQSMTDRFPPAFSDAVRERVGAIGGGVLLRGLSKGPSTR